MTDNVTPIAARFAREGWKWLAERYVICGVVSNTAFLDTSIGRVGGTTRGTVAIQEARVADAEHLSPKQARDLAGALMRAASMAERWNQKNAGYFDVRVVRVDGVVRITHHAESHPMRLVHGRRLRRCGACRGMHTVLWTAINPPERRAYEPNPARDFVRVCEACVERLVNAPTEIREVSR